MPGGNLIKGVCGRRRLFMVPEGLIVVYNGAAAPTGWTQFAAADARYIVGAGDTYAGGATGGGSVATLSITTSSAGGHVGTQVDPAMRGAAGATTYGGWTGSSYGAHTHDITEAQGVVPNYQDTLLIKADDLYHELPKNAAIFSTSSFNNLNNIYTADRLLRANNALGTGGNANATSMTISSAGAHIHVGSLAYQASTGQAAPEFQTAGAHNNALTGALTYYIKRKLLSAWSDASKEFTVENNMIAMWESATPPEFWKICDGTEGTPDLRDYFIEMVLTGSEDTTGVGNNTIDIDVSGTHGWVHDHALDQTGANATSAAHESEDHSHAHTGSENAVAFIPSYYALYFIMHSV